MARAGHVVTIDLGTSGPKAAVVRTDGVVVGSARRTVRTRLTDDGGAEQDAEAVWAASLASAGAALADAAIDPASVVAVMASAQYSSIVPVAADATPVGPMILWMDQRGHPRQLAALDGYPRRADPPTAQLRWLRVHGLPPVDPAMSLNHMRWLRYADPRTYERTHAFLEPVDLLTARLSGRITANQCSAYMMLLTDNRSLGVTDWDPGLVARSLIDPEKLPELVLVGSEVGTLVPAVAEALGLPSSTPVLSGINDTQAGAVAAGAFRGTHGGLAVGTTSAITTHAPGKKTSPRTGLFTLPSPLGDRHLLAAENGVAGVAVDHFLDQLVHPDDPFATPAPVEDRHRAFETAARDAGAGAGGVLFLPWLRGSMAPRTDARIRGGFLNVGLDTTRSDLARAVYEGVALNLRWLRGPVESFTGRTLSHFRFYGGGARSDTWSQVMADVLGAPVHQLEDPAYANSLGTALFACERLGLVGLDELADHVPVRRVYEPDPTAAARHDEQAEVFAAAFKAVRPLFRPRSRRRRGPRTAAAQG